jgi:hypothetical protein
MHIAAMANPLDPSIIEERRRAIKASYQRQIDLAGKPGYDPLLTENLKKDLDWLDNEINRISSDTFPKQEGG